LTPDLQVWRIIQRFALLVFYCALGGENWNNAYFQITEGDEYDWFQGVDPCNRFEEFQIISLEGKGLKGTLPPELSMLSTLWEVFLSDNQIFGYIPSDYSKFTDLDTLSLASNLLQGSVPEFVWR